MEKSKFGIIASFISVVALTVLLSLLTTDLLRNSEMSKETNKPLSINATMTIAEIAENNGIKVSSLKEALLIRDDKDLTKTIIEMNLSEESTKAMITKTLNFEAEEASKNFKLIFAKFISWIAFLVLIFRLIRKGKVTTKARKYLLLGSFLLFGVMFGSDPNSMSTITDMVTGYAVNGIFFPPRFIALIIFLFFGFLANKIFCGWACPFGALQDFILRLNRDSKDRKGVFPQYKVSFALSNTVRILFFVVFVLVAFLWGTSIIEVINPFNTFNPAKLTYTGISFILIMLIASLFIYRPWCHFFCPFGLVGWIVEKFSRFKIKVNYSSCVACEECAKACPSQAMTAILKQDQVIPDCFACGTCINACPTKSITFASGKTEEVPKDKFIKKKSAHWNSKLSI
ncbi:4Fe-4S binding protein [Desulfosporosinus sp. OT]|uniref:4Fe-4S binding protein n=1 Tax=Desulfosporosinus sp. OT TaxID=913865 RepID=UPI000223B25F|nr:4Fe-4S binding protein [Desulfosporosinus sp. OT]EGW38180.1 4Fe-4S binding domain protein [Desulfosporosinus sp. OT]